MLRVFHALLSDRSVRTPAKQPAVQVGRVCVCMCCGVFVFAPSAPVCVCAPQKQQLLLSPHHSFITHTLSLPSLSLSLLLSLYSFCSRYTCPLTPAP